MQFFIDCYPYKITTYLPFFKRKPGECDEIRNVYAVFSAGFPSGTRNVLMGLETIFFALSVGQGMGDLRFEMVIFAEKNGKQLEKQATRCYFNNSN